MVLAIDPVHHGVDLQLVVAFDGVEVGGPVTASVLGNVRAVRPVRGLETRDINHV